MSYYPFIGSSRENLESWVRTYKHPYLLLRERGSAETFLFLSRKHNDLQRIRHYEMLIEVINTRLSEIREK